MLKTLAAAAIAALAALASSAAAEEELVKVRFVTDWKAQAEHGGFYQAKAKGIYEKYGLDVEIVQGGPSVNVPLLLGSGEADFAIGSNSFIPLNMIAEGVPATAVASIFQKDPQVLITHPRDDIKSIADMRGKPIMISDAASGAYWIWLKASFGFDDSQIRKYTYNLAPFLADESAIQQGYITSEPYQIEKEGGFKPQLFLLADENYPSYANLILATDEIAATRPLVVAHFVQASIEGWQDYLTGDPAPGNALIKADNPEMTDDVLAQAIAKMNEYRLATAGDAEKGGIGTMTDARWQAFFEVMSANGVYKADLDWKRAYTLVFLP
ncbi:MAG: ABC transporter substrate-binding protein [Alphaproteobacteria bacterium]|jgi:NitT/TauT family transport system substrate-binding protein